MIETKDPKNLLDKNFARRYFLLHKGECNLSDNFEIKNIERHLVLSPNNYALLYEFNDQGRTVKIRANASLEETRERAYKVMNLIWSDFQGPVFCIPRVYFYDSEFNVVFYENVEGKIFISQLKEQNLEQKMELIGEWLSKLHSFPVSYIELPEHEIHFNYQELSKFYQDLANNGPEVIEKLKSQISTSHSLKIIHGDYQPNNIILEENKITVFDFNDSQISDPALDLAKFLSQLKVMLFRFGDVSVFENLEKIFWESYKGEYIKDNYLIYRKMYFLQILCSLSASLANDPESQKTLPEVKKYYEEG